MNDKSGQKPGSGREQRLGAALRANLKRRKEQARERAKDADSEGTDEKPTKAQPGPDDR